MVRTWLITGGSQGLAHPRRLLLGSDALGLALDAEAARRAEVRAWAAVTRSTDLPA
jgi:hypothetical protein